MDTNARQILYGVLALAGLVGTWTFNLRFMAEEGGFTMASFVAGGFVNPAASSLSVDLLVSCLAFLCWLFFESARLGMRRPWIYLLLTFGVAFAFAFPLFLLMRERRLAAAATAP